MNFTEMVDKMKKEGITSVAPFKLKGKAKPFFEMLSLMNYTEPFSQPKTYWEIMAQYYTFTGGSRYRGEFEIVR